MIFSVQDRLKKLYTAVEDLQELDKATTMPFTKAQLVEIALGVLKRTGDYELTIENWYVSNTPARNWLGLKTHFNNVRRLLRKARGVTIKVTGFHGVNQPSATLQTVQNDMKDINKPRKQ